METEFKFRLDDTSVFDMIVENAEIKAVGIDEVETIEMKATYYDTVDYDLRNKGIAFRTRMEDDRCTATVKWDVNVSKGLHKREEFNLVVSDERFADNPKIDFFVSSDAYDVLKDEMKAIHLETARLLIRNYIDSDEDGYFCLDI